MEPEKRVVVAEEKREPLPVVTSEKVIPVVPCPVCEARRKRLAEKMRVWRAKRA